MLGQLSCRYMSMPQRTLLVSSGNFTFGRLQLSLMVLDDELPYSLDLGLSLTRSPLLGFQVHVLVPVTMNEISDAPEICAAEVKDGDGFEDGEANCFVLGAIRDDWKIGEFGTRPGFARLHQHVVPEVVGLQSLSEGL